MSDNKNVYNPDAYAYRVQFAASVISKGANATRRFDTCFEMYDGCAVAAALVRRVLANPSSKLAANIWSYIGRETAMASYEATKNMTVKELAEYAASLRSGGGVSA